MTYKSLMLYTLLMALVTAAMLALSHAAGLRASLPGSDAEIVLSVTGTFALVLLIVFQPWRKDKENA